jgi:hypothetical protein
MFHPPKTKTKSSSLALQSRATKAKRFLSQEITSRLPI